jgi:hypothetical protein
MLPERRAQDLPLESLDQAKLTSERGPLPDRLDERAILHGLVLRHEGDSMRASRCPDESVRGVPRKARRVLKGQRRDLRGL